MENDIYKVLSNIKEDFYDPFQGGELGKFVFCPSKRIRSRLSLMIVKAMNNGEVPDVVYSVLATGELVHNASLLHDDVLDNASKRRGQKTLNSLFGTKSAILAGDYLLSLSMKKLEKVNNAEVASLFRKCMSDMILGEISQSFLKGSVPSEQEYLDICTKKTAVLFRTMVESSLILIEKNSQDMISFAELFGIYFQIKNDIEDFSAQADRQNGVHTAFDVWGIEKTKALLDNYEEEMRGLLNNIPNKIYEKQLRDLLKEI